MSHPKFQGFYLYRDGCVLTEGDDGKLILSLAVPDPRPENKGRQTWIVIPSKSFEDGYYLLQNYGSKRYLAAWPPRYTTEQKSHLITSEDEEGAKKMVWAFSYAESDEEGIPPTQTKFRLCNLQSSRFPYGDCNTILTLDDENGRSNFNFRLVAPRSITHQDAYMIESVNTTKFSGDSNVGTDEHYIVKLTAFNDRDPTQFWVLIPSTEFEGSYWIRNYGTRRFLLDRPIDNAGLRTTLAIEDKYPEQSWIFQRCHSKYHLRLRPRSCVT